MTEHPVLLLLSSFSQRLTAALDEKFETIKLFEAERPEAVLAANADRIRGIASNGKVSASLVESLPRLEIIANFGVGVDGIDLAAARHRNVVVTNTPSVADRRRCRQRAAATAGRDPRRGGGRQVRAGRRVGRKAAARSWHPVWRASYAASSAWGE